MTALAHGCRLTTVRQRIKLEGIDGSWNPL